MFTISLIGLLCQKSSQGLSGMTQGSSPVNTIGNQTIKKIGEFAQSSSQWPELELLVEAENQSTNPSGKKIA